MAVDLKAVFKNDGERIKFFNTKGINSVFLAWVYDTLIIDADLQFSNLACHSVYKSCIT